MGIRVLLADDHPLARAGIRAALEKAADIEIVGEAHDGAEVRRLTAELRPDVVLLDLVMPGLRPVEFVHWVQANCPATEVLPLTAHDWDYYLAEMLEAGAAGFLTKSEPLERLVERVRCAARGQMLFSKEQRGRVKRWREEVGERWESLTAREREVLRLVAEGKTDKEIAQALQVKVKTVENHVSRILEKLGVNSRTRAALWAVREGLIRPGGRIEENTYVSVVEITHDKPPKVVVK